MEQILLPVVALLFAVGLIAIYRVRGTEGAWQQLLRGFVPGMVVILVFTLIAASSVAVPVIAYLVASARMAGPLESLRAWLVHNNATVMAVLLLVIGVVVIGKGIGNF